MQHPSLQYGGGLAAPQDPMAARKTYPHTRILPYRSRITVFLRQIKNTGSNRAMNASPEMNFDELLGVRLAVLQREHRDLDEAIHALEVSGRPDVLTLRRLKKHKLALKDQIVRIEDKLIPNIIA